MLFPIRFFVGLYELYLKQIAKHNKKIWVTRKSILINRNSLLKIMFIINNGVYRITMLVILILSLSHKYFSGNLSPSLKI